MHLAMFWGVELEPDTENTEIHGRRHFKGFLCTNSFNLASQENVNRHYLCFTNKKSEAREGNAFNTSQAINGKRWIFQRVDC